LLLLLHCFIFILVLLLCCVSRSSLYCNIPSDFCSLCLSCYYFYIVLSLLLHCCYVVYPDQYFTVIYHLQIVYSVSVLLLFRHCFILIVVLSLCCVYRSSLYCVLVLFLLLFCFIFILVLLLCSLYCNINSDLCTLCLACYYFCIVYSLYLYCSYVMYPDHHFTVI
jgi:hypothetical protein